MLDVTTKNVAQATSATFKEKLIDNWQKDKQIKLGDYDEINMEVEDVIMDLDG